MFNFGFGVSADPNNAQVSLPGGVRLDMHADQSGNVQMGMPGFTMGVVAQQPEPHHHHHHSHDSSSSDDEHHHKKEKKPKVVKPHCDHEFFMHQCKKCGAIECEATGKHNFICGECTICNRKQCAVTGEHHIMCGECTWCGKAF